MLKNKKIVLGVICFLVILGVVVMFVPKNGDVSQNINEPIFIGKILEIEDTKDNKRLLVQGYMRGCEVYEETLLALVNEETEILGNCNDEKIKEFSVGDKVYIELSEAFTKSIPPQSVAKKIQVSKVR